MGQDSCGVGHWRLAGLVNPGAFSARSSDPMNEEVGSEEGPGSTPCVPRAHPCRARVRMRLAHAAQVGAKIIIAPSSSSSCEYERPTRVPEYPQSTPLVVASVRDGTRARLTQRCCCGPECCAASVHTTTHPSTAGVSVRRGGGGVAAGPPLRRRGTMLPLLRRRGTQLPLERSVRGVAPACGMPLHPPVVHVGIVVHDGDDDDCAPSRAEVVASAGQPRVHHPPETAAGNALSHHHVRAAEGPSSSLSCPTVPEEDEPANNNDPPRQPLPSSFFCAPCHPGKRPPHRSSTRKTSDNPGGPSKYTWSVPDGNAHDSPSRERK